MKPLDCTLYCYVKRIRNPSVNKDPFNNSLRMEMHSNNVKIDIIYLASYNLLYFIYHHQQANS